MSGRATSRPRIGYQQWLSWAGPVTPAADKASGSTFRSSLAQTLDLLLDELEWLGATAAVLETAHAFGERRKDGHPHASHHLRGTGRDGVRLSFTGTAGPLRFSTDRFYGWEANARAIALGLKALRAVDRYGIGQAAEQYTGWKQLGAGTTAAAAPTNGAMSRVAALDLIGRWTTGALHYQLPTAGPELVRLYRKARGAAHPDRNDGDSVAFLRLEQAGRVLGLVE